ncbi:hypothetical protein [Georgenia satyanarayanai]|uniref:hypothetical protein n=1 Tax=Georgenia satyanarayanai TaxID=860221 RepID=UPI0012649CA4|nr:hypothetical protein [Georgenia satyanarayanai]
MAPHPPAGRRRPLRRAVVLAAATGLCALAACGTQSAPVDPGAPAPGTSAAGRAEVLETGPDCLADDVVAGMSLLPHGAGRPGPAPGTVPPDFVPAAVVECRVPFAELVQEPAPPTLVPRLDDLDPTGPGAAGEPDVVQRLTVEEVTLTGDLGPLLAVLARDSAPPSTGACMAKMEMKPVIFLVDGEGRAVWPQWPVDGCGFLLDGTAAALEGLTETGVTVHEIDQCVGPCTTAEDD